MKPTSPSVPLSKIRTDLDEDSWLEVRCLSSGRRSVSGIRGEWTLHLATKDEDDVRKIPVVTWRTHETKTIKTIPGLVALALRLGIDFPEIPLRDGDVSVWTRSGVSASLQQRLGAAE